MQPFFPFFSGVLQMWKFISSPTMSVDVSILLFVGYPFVTAILGFSLEQGGAIYIYMAT